MIKVAALLVVLAIGLARGEDAEVTTVAAEEVKMEVDPTAKAEEEKKPEKRGLFRLTGVHGENPQYQVLYTLPQQLPQPVYQHPIEPRAVASAPQAYKPYFPSYQQPYALPLPYSQPTTMLLLMMPPHPGNPYGSLMLVPASSVFTPNHIMPYNAPARLPVQFVPQYVPLLKGYQSPAAHFKDQYPQYQKPLGPQYQEQPPQYQEQPQQYQEQPQQYQEQQSSSEEVSQEHPSPSASQSQDYGASTRARLTEQYVKG